MVESLYIHIPFCLSKCPYCSFSSTAHHDRSIQDQYVEVLMNQIAERLQGSGSLKTLFFGGGTPTILSVENLEKLLNCCFKYGKLIEGAEISIEANPKTISHEKLRRIKEAGVNRLSIGVQSFNEQELKLLSRPYSVADVEEIIDSAAAVGFSNVSLDLMYGLPLQTEKLWQKSIEKALSYPVQHLSIYQLTVEEGTPYANMLNSGNLLLPDEDTIEGIDTITGELTDTAGFMRYEISNYARKSFECHHNISYWQNLEYFGIGAGAVEYLDRERRWYETEVHRYLEQGRKGAMKPKQIEVLDKEASFRESVIMGLRMIEGVSIDTLLERYGIDCREYYGDILRSLLAMEMVEIQQDRLCLTEKGLRLANTIMAELV